MDANRAELTGQACRMCGRAFELWPEPEPSYEGCCASCEARQASGKVPRMPPVREWLAQQAEASGAASPYSLLDNVTVTGSEGPDPKLVHGLAKMLTLLAKAESEARGDE